MSLKDIKYSLFYRPHDNPLETFYLPTLEASIHYDRSAGYFRSSALAAAAAGIVRLIQNNGRMRLLVGAALTEQDIQAIRAGYDLRQTLSQALLAQWPPAGLVLDGPLQKRLDALTWMVAQGTLDIKVVLPLDHNGFPIPGHQTHDYYHAKKGIFTDAEGNQVGFMGSINESAQAWQHNFEEFTVYCSWKGEDSRATLGYLRASFNELWEGHDPHWIALDLPDAVRDALIQAAPNEPPTHDPLERPRHTAQLGEENGTFAATAAPDRPRPGHATPHERLLFQFLRDAPTLLNAHDLAAATSNIDPWPHQLQVARTLFARFPGRALLCDEVGLGKTIEAGLVIRQLLLTGRVQRCLILTPAAVLRQWQEELYEKFNLDIPRYQGRQLYDAAGNPLGPPTDDPWAECDLLLASSHLAKRRERVEQLVAAPPWELLVVDEAHHARRKDFLQPHYRPNRLLTLLNQLKENEQYQGLLLLTATPMQVHPVEVWDLLTALGLGGRWGADEKAFLNFFSELRRPFTDAEWDFIFDLVADYWENTGQNGHTTSDGSTQDGPLDPHFYQTMHTKLGSAHAEIIRTLPQQHNRRTIVRNLPEAARPYVLEMARRHTPLQHYLFRNTRDLLRQYVKKGLLQANVPIRQPITRRIPFLPEEAELYGRITEYISEFYSRYESQRSGLGFIMTVYRRRLTSSFYAARKSLERRRAWLLGQLDFGEALTLEDEVDLEELEELEQAGLDLHGLDPQQGMTAGQRQQFQAELSYLDSFISDLQTLSQGDSKVNQLKDELNAIFSSRSTVIIFTQYTDTMDYLREQLQTVYGGQIACYSGRGGEIWQGMTWQLTTKEFVKNQFKEEKIKILLCTESASEGLNLQTCGVLINYDMPWNPMRVEQRIGRIDRIGQRYKQVHIYNYFYRDTIEDRIHQALKDRISWFENIVGKLQPILADVTKMTRDLAMLPAERQAAELEQAIQKLSAEIEQAQIDALDLDNYLEPEEPRQGLQTPVQLPDLERILTQSAVTSHLFRPHQEWEGAYWLRWRGEQIAVTFHAELFDQFPATLHFLSYGSPLLAQILAAIPAPEEYPPHLLRTAHGAAGQSWPLHGWYDLRHPQPTLVDTVNDLQQLLQVPAIDGETVEERTGRAVQHFLQEAQALSETYHHRLAQHVQQQQAILQEKGRRLLEQAALIEIALGQQRSILDNEPYPTGFNQGAVQNLARHGGIWHWLFAVATNKGQTSLPQPKATDPYYEQIRNEKQEKLKTMRSQIADKAEALVTSWQRMQNTPP